MSESPASETVPTATRVRYLIVFCATLMSFLLYLDRFCVSFAIDYIRQDLGLTQGDAKWFLSAFFWSYALAQVPAGWMSDRYGARIMLVIYILTWSAFTGVIGAAPSFLIVMVGRVLCGGDCIASVGGGGCAGLTCAISRLSNTVQLLVSCVRNAPFL